MSARGWLRMARAGLNFRLITQARQRCMRHHTDQKGSSLLSLLLLAGTMSAMWFVFLMNIVSMGEAQVAERSDFASVSYSDESLDVAGSAVEAIAADLSAATWTDLSDGSQGLSSITLARYDRFGGLPLAETVRYEVARGALERTSGTFTEVVVSGVTSVSFSRSGKTVTTSLEIESTSGIFQTVEFTALLSSF